MRNVTVTLPTLHEGQVKILTTYKNALSQPIRNRVVRCGRRWGKTLCMVTIAADRAIKGGKVGLFAPETRQLDEPWDSLIEILGNLIRTKNRGKGRIRLWTGGLIDLWALNDNELAGRGREYDDVLIDEAAFTKNKQMLAVWKKSIKPTMLTRRGRAWVFSTPNGDDPENFFWQCCNSPEMGFTEFHAPTNTNPYVPEDEFELERLNNDPRVFRQEYLAEFVDWSGDAFFDLQRLLVDGQGVPYPDKCDYVFATLDTAVKTGKKNDGTAVAYWAVSKYVGHPLILLDWDYVQVEGAFLEDYMPSVYARLEELARETGARAGSIGALIEDAASGSILLQQAAKHGWAAAPMPAGLTAAGKEGRAISVSQYVWQQQVKFSQYAHEKVVVFKNQSRNHMQAQVGAFRIGLADGAADDCLDAFCYGIAVALGDGDGY